jgi:hypothetical protein
MWSIIPRTASRTPYIYILSQISLAHFLSSDYISTRRSFDRFFLICSRSAPRYAALGAGEYAYYHCSAAPTVWGSNAAWPAVNDSWLDWCGAHYIVCVCVGGGGGGVCACDVHSYVCRIPPPQLYLVRASLIPRAFGPLNCRLPQPLFLMTHIVLVAPVMIRAQVARVRHAPRRSSRTSREAAVAHIRGQQLFALESKIRQRD